MTERLALNASSSIREACCGGLVAFVSALVKGPCRAKSAVVARGEPACAFAHPPRSVLEVPLHRFERRITVEMKSVAALLIHSSCPRFKRRLSPFQRHHGRCSFVAPNPSVKGTSCGKPQAAPYVER